jgi:hypothetical protein
MYQFNDCLTQLFTKDKYIILYISASSSGLYNELRKCGNYKYIWLWLQCFDPYLGHRQVYIMNLESVGIINIFGFGYSVSTLFWVIVRLL